MMSTMGKKKNWIKVRKVKIARQGWGVKFFNRKIRLVTMKMTIQQRYERVTDLPRTISNKVTPDKGIGYLKGHKVGSCLAYLRNSKEATMSD